MESWSTKVGRVFATESVSMTPEQFADMMAARAKQLEAQSDVSQSLPLIPRGLALPPSPPSPPS